MVDANATQVSGAHYKSDYQHWDWVHDVGLDYLGGNASKYVARWRRKNGEEDLDKALHYIDKAKQRKVGSARNVSSFEDVVAGTSTRSTPRADPVQVATEKFAAANDLTFVEYRAVLALAKMDWDEARKLVVNIKNTTASV